MTQNTFTMKALFKPGFAVLAILVAVSLAKAETIFEQKVAGTDKKIVDVMLASKVNPEALKKALTYYDQYKSRFPNQKYLTLIDYSKPSTEKRMVIFDLKTGQSSSYLVAHGMGSGGLKANTFSNAGKSGTSSLGMYRTAEVYNGKHGRSLKLDGLSSSNSNARARAVVIHAAGYLRLRVNGKTQPIAYVSPEMIAVQGRLGRSLGCPALDPRVAQKVIDQLKGGSLIYAFNK